MAKHVDIEEEYAAREQAWRRLAKTACNAFEALMAVCITQSPLMRDPPLASMHPDDWRRMQNWQKEIDAARAVLGLETLHIDP